jgi:phytoene dehydrogenase-like protein
MAHEVVVVGGGIGGLTAAALLAARGAGVCLFERAPRGGGCAAGFRKFGYDFETTAGLYSSWGRNELHERVFAELPVERPEARRLTPSYVVRLPDGTDVSVGGASADARVGGAGGDEFEETLRASFPECAGRAVEFYRGLAPLADAAARALERFPALTETSKLQRARLAASDPRAYRRLTAARAETVAEHLAGTSRRFRAFLDAQLRAFALAPADECSYPFAASALTAPLRGLYSLRGGAPALADALTDSIKRSGGAVRFDAPVLRLAYDAAGRAVGVDLLSGERVEAARAVVSNLTAWDTYGKLVGAGRAPADVRSRLKTLRGRSAYLLFLGADDAAIARLPATHLLAAARPDGGEDGAARDDQDDAARSEFFFGSSPAWDARAPEGRRAVTVSTHAEAEDWFAFHEDEAAHEEQDAAALAAWWARLHAALPELGAGIEVIETLTPRDYYEQTRRRLGMVGGTPRTPAALSDGAFTHRTHLPNLYMVGDTIFPGGGLAGATRSALAVANEIAPPR